MANDSGNSNLGIELPIGYRFCPNDDDLIVLLRRKVLLLPLPWNEIREYDDVLSSNPWDLPGDSKKTRYLFIARRSFDMTSNLIVSGCGYWKTTDEDEPILAPGTNFAIGFKKCYVFYKGETHLKTQWVMEQFCLVRVVNSEQPIMVQLGDWLVCRIYHEIQRDIELGFEFDDQGSVSLSSSGITEYVSSSESDQEAESQNIH